MIEEIALAIQALESSIIENIANEALAAHQSLVDLGSSNSVKDSLKKWKLKVKRQLNTTPIETNLDKETDYYQEVKNYSNEFFTSNITTIINNIPSDSPFYLQAYELLNQDKKDKKPLFQQLFCEAWYQSLLNHIKEERVENINTEKLLNELYQRSETINQLNEIDGQVSDQKNLRLWDMAKAKLSRRDLSQLSKIAKILNQNNQLQQIAKTLGRMAEQIKTDSVSRVEIEEIRKVEAQSVDSSGDIVGIHESDDIERLLTTEMTYLTTPELETVFYKRFADKGLSTYQLQSAQQRNQKTITFKNYSEKATLDKGPFIIAVDASGSMMGTPEQYAKAFAYALMQIALTENRDCYIMIFSTQLITYELTKESGLTEILSFLSYSFNGGTDLAPVIEQAIDLMSNKKYINADLIIISDFIAPAQSEVMLNKMVDIQKRKNRFHALNLSKHGNPELLASFDHYWQYTPSKLNKLRQLIKLK